MVSSELRFLPGNRAAFADQDGRSRFERTELGGTKPADRSCESKCGNLQRGECMKTPSASPGAGGFFMSGRLAALQNPSTGLHLCLARSFSQTHSETKRRSTMTRSFARHFLRAPAVRFCDRDPKLPQ